MDRLERLDDITIALVAAAEGAQSAIWTALPCEITEFSAEKMTCSAQPMIKARYIDKMGVVSWIKMPLLVDVPVVFPSAGGYSLTFPVKPGDSALVVFSSRCIDAWWDSGKLGIQSDLRMHDLSDGFAILGPRARPKTLSPSVATDSVELRNDEKTSYIQIADSGAIKLKTNSVTITATSAGVVTIDADEIILESSGVTRINASAVSIDAANVGITGDLVVFGTITGDGKLLSTHKHSGVTVGGGLTGNNT